VRGAAVVEPQAYIELEEAQVNTGIKALDKVSASWVAGFGLALEAGDLDKAADLASNLDLSGASARIKKTSLVLADSLVNFGAAQSLNGDESSTTVEPLLDPLVLNTQTFILNALQTAQTKAVQVAQGMVGDAMMAKKGEAFKAEVDAIKPLKAAANSLAINLQQMSSRLASYGYLLQAKQNGDVLYMLSAILDDRTSEFCRAIHGKIIPVKVGIERAISVMGASSPEEAAALAPWPVQDQDTITRLKKAGYDELLSMGFLLPPFHPWCRTILQFVDVANISTIITSTETVGTAPLASSATLASNALSAVANPATTAFDLSLLGVGAAILAAIAGDDGDSIILPGYDTDTVKAALEDIETGDGTLQIMERYGMSWFEVTKLRNL